MHVNCNTTRSAARSEDARAPETVKKSDDAKGWRRFVTSAPPIDDLVEIKRLHDNKTILRRRCELPASFTGADAEWRPVR